MPFGLDVGAGLGTEVARRHSPLRRLLELDARSRDVGLADRDFDAARYLSRKWSSHEDVESVVPGIFAGVVFVSDGGSALV